MFRALPCLRMPLFCVRIALFVALSIGSYIPIPETLQACERNSERLEGIIIRALRRSSSSVVP